MTDSDGHKLNRYPGVKPFSEKDNKLFFGRKKDVEAFNDLLFVKQHVVLYGKSGYGKSSLINAGVIPTLKEQKLCVYFLIRFNNYSEKKLTESLSPLENVKKRLNVKIKIRSEFYNVIPNEDSLWYWIKQNQLNSDKTKFIIFFDQFEELFTYPKEEIADFSEQLSQLLYGSIPVNYRKKIDELNEKGEISEKLQIFLYEKPEIKVVFSIRGDRLSQLNILTDRHPSILQNCYELDALTIEDAATAITQPAKLNDAKFKTEPFEYTDGAVGKILKSIANAQDKKVETATLQIVCKYVEDMLVAEKGNRIITEELLGNITDIFQKYYEALLNSFTTEERTKVQPFIEDALIDGDRRNSLTDGYIENRLNIPLRLLGILEQSSLLRKERDASGRILYEISHDSLIAAINKVAEKRRIREEEEKKLQIERQLEDERLQLEKQQSEKRLQLEKQLEEEKLRTDELKKLNSKAKTSVRMAIILAVICLVIAVVAFGFKRQADKEKTEASIAEQHAILNLYKNNLLKAEDCINKANIFMKSNDNIYAITNLKRADSLILKPKIKLPSSVDSEKRQLHGIIISLLKNCNEK
jgi:hypothetical protein